MSHLKWIVLLIVYFTPYCLTLNLTEDVFLPFEYEYITELDVSLDEVEEKDLQSRGFKRIYVDLNKGAGGKFIYLWYKKEYGFTPITRLQVTFNDDMAVGLIIAGYTKINKDLNAGTGGDTIYLWYFKGDTVYDISLEKIDVTTDAEDEARKLQSGWERLACDLNRNAKGDWIHIWMKRKEKTYICDVTVTDSFESDADYFNAGYIRVDEDTNRGAKGAFVFIWYRQRSNSYDKITDLQISNTDFEFQLYQLQGYTLVNVDLNRGTGGHQVYLWYKRDWVFLLDNPTPTEDINLLLNPAAFKVYERAGAKVIYRNLNAGNNGVTMYVSIYRETFEWYFWLYPYYYYY